MAITARSLPQTTIKSSALLLPKLLLPRNLPRMPPPKPMGIIQELDSGMLAMQESQLSIR